VKLTDPIAISPEVVAREVGGETMLLDLASGTYFGLDAVGSRVWQLIEDQGVTLAGACDILVGEYEVSREDLERDVLALAGQLVENGLIVCG
jgi:Coenzyme PQQ synthesis protein D (PqqD)